MMKPLIIAVRAVQGGWAVTSDLMFGPLMFLSGARAERQACRLATAAAAAGHDVEVAVHDLAGALIASIPLDAGPLRPAVAPPPRPRFAPRPEPALMAAV